MADEPPLPSDSEAAARFHAYNDFLRQSHFDPMGEAFAAGWKAAIEYQQRKAATETDDNGN